MKNHSLREFVLQICQFYSNRFYEETIKRMLLRRRTFVVFVVGEGGKEVAVTLSTISYWWKVLHGLKPLLCLLLLGLPHHSASVFRPFSYKMFDPTLTYSADYILANWIRLPKKYDVPCLGKKPIKRDTEWRTLDVGCGFKEEHSEARDLFLFTKSAFNKFPSNMPILEFFHIAPQEIQIKKIRWRGGWRGGGG